MPDAIGVVGIDRGDDVRTAFEKLRAIAIRKVSTRDEARNLLDGWKRPEGAQVVTDFAHAVFNVQGRTRRGKRQPRVKAPMNVVDTFWTFSGSVEEVRIAKYLNLLYARMAELADAQDSGSRVDRRHSAFLGRITGLDRRRLVSPAPSG